MRDCWTVPAEAWRQLRDARWEKLQRANFYACLGRRGDVFGFPAFCMRRGGAVWAVPLHNGASPAWKNRRPRCFSRSSQGAEGAGALLSALARCSQLQDTPSKGRSKVLTT